MRDLDQPSGLWSDEPTGLDLLSFSAVASTITSAILDDRLDPVAIGVSGSWGSGKTTVLRLIATDLDAIAVDVEGWKVLTVSTDPWRYDPTVGAKETLIGEVLATLAAELDEFSGSKEVAVGLVQRLSKRINWSKALKLAAKASLTFQLPSVDDLTQLINDKSSPDGKSEPRGLEEFRSEFATLMEEDALAHVKRVVVLVDDLDRCLPETVVETLETIRLFLAVPKMSFVIAADDQRVAEAIRIRFKDAPMVPTPSADGDSDDELREEPSSLYLHKIVQTTVPVPTLSKFDTEAYLVLLQLGHQMEDGELQGYIDACANLRRSSGTLDDLPTVSDRDIASEMAFAARLTPILYEKLRGNPRRIKRFLNDLQVRESIADLRGISLDPAIVAKLMVLEVLLRRDFDRVLSWLAKGELRDRLVALEAAAGRRVAEKIVAPEEKKTSETKSKTPRDKALVSEQENETASPFSDGLIRWAKLPPALSTLDLAPYLYLAASFTGKALLDTGLPGRLRDIAANLLSSVRAAQKSVKDEDLQALTSDDAIDLVQHLGRAARDQPSTQRIAIGAVLRVTRFHPAAAESARRLLATVPAQEIEPAVIIGFTPGDVGNFVDVLRQWRSGAGASTRRAIDAALKDASI